MKSIQEDIVVDLILRYNRTIYLPDGLGGFENAKEYILYSNNREAPLIWLESKTVSNLSFVTVDPFLFFPDYRPEFEDQDLEFLEIENPDDLFILCIGNFLNHSSHNMTINMAAPILINWSTGKGKQVVITNKDQYSKECPIILRHSAAA